MSPQEFDQADAWFDRHGGAAVFIGRLVPTVRTFISVPAGMARMPLWRFLAYSTSGTVIWTALLALAGYLLESQYERVQAWLNPVSTAIVVGIVALYLWRVATYNRRQQA
jgi:membrane protein DedA with SNARE-associated domain